MDAGTRAATPQFVEHEPVGPIALALDRVVFDTAVVRPSHELLVVYLLRYV